MLLFNLYEILLMLSPSAPISSWELTWTILSNSRLDIFSATLLISTIGLVIFLEKNKINKEPAEKTIKPAMR